MSLRAVLASAAIVLTAAALTGCASAAAPSQPVPTATVTATVTATAEPVTTARSPEDPLTALDAWLLCWGATFGEYHESSELFPYSVEAGSGGDTVTDNGDGTFEVLVPFAPSSGQGWGAESICIAGGTVGDPSVQLQGGRDFG